MPDAPIGADGNQTAEPAGNATADEEDTGGLIPGPEVPLLLVGAVVGAVWARRRRA